MEIEVEDENLQGVNEIRTVRDSDRYPSISNWPIILDQEYPEHQEKVPHPLISHKSSKGKFPNQ